VHSTQAAKDAFDTFRPHPEDIVTGTKAIAEGVKNRNASQVLAGAGVAMMGVVDLVDVVPDASDALQKAGRETLKDTTEKTIDKVKDFKGGAYKDMKNPVGDGLDAHHMPADSTTSIPINEGPAIQMIPEDHAMTSSYKNTPLSKAYRAEIQGKIENGDMRGAMAQEIKDVKDATGSKYNKAMQEMLKYAKDKKMLNK